MLFRIPGSAPTLWLQDKSRLITELPGNDKCYVHIQPFQGSALYLVADQRSDETELVLEQTGSGGSSARPQEPGTDSDYLSLVEIAKESIVSTELEKVALSRLLSIKKQIDPVRAFAEACRSLPNAFVYFLQTPEVGTWLGATPEKLASVRNRSISIDSIAATRGNDKTPSQAEQWNSKEIHEQAIVTESITGSLIESGCSDIRVDGPRVLKAGPVSHLHTVVSANYHIDPLPIILSLHPTPAVGGYPKASADRFIRDNEAHDRRLYAGFIGIHTSVEQADYFVNIRCMQVFPDQVQLYLGCGITAGSVPDAELKETYAKAMTWQEIIER